MIDKILVVGNSTVDDVITADGHFYKSICGGNSIHASMAASRIADNVALLTVVPRNFPKKYLNDLKRQNIDTSAVKVADRDVLLEELFIYEKNGDRRDGLYLNPEDVPSEEFLTREQIEEYASTHEPGGYSFGDLHRDYKPDLDDIDSNWNVISVHLAPTDLSVHKRFALREDIKIKTLDPGRYLIGMDYSEVMDLISKMSVFLPSKKEMGYIFPGMDLRKATIKLGKESKTDVVCKNGPEGCFVYDHNVEKLYKVGVFQSCPVDPTGAGDSFCGAMNACLCNGYSLLDSVRMASVVAAKAIETISATERSRINSSFVYENYKLVKYSMEDLCE